MQTQYKREEYAHMKMWMIENSLSAVFNASYKKWTKAWQMNFSHCHIMRLAIEMLSTLDQELQCVVTSVIVYYNKAVKTN